MGMMKSELVQLIETVLTLVSDRRFQVFKVNILKLGMQDIAEFLLGALLSG